MELKRYQQDVVADLVGYLGELDRQGSPSAAYRAHWSRKGVLVGADTLPGYQDAVPRVPHVCLKVPTAGGKTFIACNCLCPIFDALPTGEGNLVLWLVPSLAILEQTLRNLSPRFTLELTATPRSSSNIISTVRAYALKGQNMVKLPVIVYNDHDATQVLQNAISLRGHLETMAVEQEEGGGPYIRPIVLVQAEPRSGLNAETFQRLKQKLIEADIPEEQVAIKTVEIDQIRGRDLLSPDCPIRSSQVEVEQILGRILRQPYARRQPADLLNLSYVFTCSTQFHATLDEIVRGLNRAGFSEKDYRVAAEQPMVVPPAAARPDLPEERQPDPVESIQSTTIAQVGGQPAVQMERIAAAARRQEQEYQAAAEGVAPPSQPGQSQGGTLPRRFPG